MGLIWDFLKLVTEINDENKENDRLDDDTYNFEEEDLEEDDYYYEDDQKYFIYNIVKCAIIWLLRRTRGFISIFNRELVVGVN